MFWTPPNWVYNSFPQPTPDTEVVALKYVVETLHAEADKCVEYDTLPLGPAMHVCHMLVAHQGADGLWAAKLNLRTGEDIGQERSDAPSSLMRRLNQMLDSCEYDFALRRAEEGIRARQAK